MDSKNDLLLVSAARLYRLGLEVEAARSKLRKLVEQGVSYDSDEMKRSYLAFKELDQQWKALEQQHLALRDEIIQGDCRGLYPDKN